MKRRISLLLAVVMILGSFSFAFAANDVNVPEFLNKEGIFVGDKNGDLMLDKTLTREEAVVLLARLLKVEKEAGEFKVTEELPSFKDTKKIDPYWKPFIAWAESNEYFKGHQGKRQGEFGFGDNLTAKQYAIVLLRALGYEEADDWKKAFGKAEELGLLKDVRANADDEIVRKTAAQMTFNALGTEMADGKGTLAKKLGIKMPEDKPEELKVEKVYTENLAEVVVELSNAELVKNKESLTNPANYRFDDSSIRVYNAELKGDDVVLTLVPYGRLDEIKENATPLTKGKEYDLTIRNIDPVINKTYRDVEAKDNAVPSVEKVEFMGTHGIKVVTSEPIVNPLERNFRISDKRASMIVEQYGREIVLTPYHGKAFDKDATELVVEELLDFAGYKSAKTVEAMELDEKTTAPKVVEAYRSGNKLTLVFDQDVYHESIKSNESRRELGNVSFVERRVTFYAETAKKVDTNVVEYKFEREIPKNAEVTVEGVQNHSKETMEKDVVTPDLFVDEYAPVVISDLSTAIRTEGNEKAGDKLVSETTGLTIKFDKDIKEFENGKDAFERDYRVEDFFNLYVLEVAKRNEISEDVEIKVVEVKKDSIKLDFVNKANKDELHVNNRYRDYDYVLEVKNFRDLSGNRMVREYIDFQILPKATVFNADIEKIDNVRYFNRNDVEITLKFNGYVDKASAEDASNYYINGKLLVDEAIVEKDGLTVTLVIKDMTKAELLEDYDTLEISPRVKNLAKNATVYERFLNLRFEAVEAADKEAVKEEAKKFEGETFANKAAVEAVSITEGIIVNVEVTKEATKQEKGKAKVTLSKGKAKEEVVVTLEKLPLDGAPKGSVKELTVDGWTNDTDEFLFLVAGLMNDEGTAQEAVSLREAKRFIDAKYNVNFNISNIKINNGNIKVENGILSSEDWAKVKANGDASIPYRITVLKNDKTSKVAKIAMYENGDAVIEKLD